MGGRLSPWRLRGATGRPQRSQLSPAPWPFFSRCRKTHSTEYIWDLTGFRKRLMTRQHPTSQLDLSSSGLCKSEGFYRRTVGKGAISKEKQGLFWGRCLFSAGRGWKGFHPAGGLCSLRRRERAQVTDDLPGAGPENPRLVDEEDVSGRVETAIRSGTKSRFGAVGFSMSFCLGSDMPRRSYCR